MCYVEIEKTHRELEMEGGLERREVKGGRECQGSSETPIIKG